MNKPVLPLILGVGLAIINPSHEPTFAAGVVGSGTATSCTHAALTAALAGGGNVTFRCGFKPVVITVTSQKDIKANTSIDGGNLVTLSGGGTHRIFNIADGVTFITKNLAIANGFTADQGAAINNAIRGRVIVDNCKFDNNRSSKSGEFGGGAIFSGPMGTLTVDKSTFTRNKASLGGAIRILNSNSTITNSTFTGNHAVDPTIGDGGAIYIDGANGDNGKIILGKSTFTNNSATSYGGALFNHTYNSNQTTIDGSTFTGNRVGGSSNGQGGAIWSGGAAAPIGGIWRTPNNNTTFSVRNTLLSGNTASQQGGGIWLGNHPAGISIATTTISHNTATSSNGGGVVLGDNGKLSVTNSTIAGNKVIGPYSLGGGLMIASGQTLITNSTIAGNYASWQGGGIVNGNNAPVTLANTIIASNKANNGGNNWNITHNCFLVPMINGGNNLQFPAPIAGDINCTAGIRTTNPKLGSLGRNGGSTPTKALLQGSPAINAANPSRCPLTDQRGTKRPQGRTCDIGAFEANQ